MYSYRLCSLWPPRGWTLRTEKSSSCFMPPNSGYYLPNFLLSQHMDLLSPTFCKWIFKSRNWNMLPCAFYRSHRSKMARSSWPSRVFLLCCRVSFYPVDCLSHQSLLEESVQDYFNLSTSLLSLYTDALCSRVSTVATCEGKKRRSSRGFEKVC